MKLQNFVLTLFVLLLTNSVSHSQNVTIDYQSLNQSNPPCNVFAGGVNVPVTVRGKQFDYKSWKCLWTTAIQHVFIDKSC